MKRIISLRSICLAALLLLLAPVCAHADETGWRAGVAKTKITPPKLMWMAGYGARNRPAEGKLTELWAKALVLEVGEGERTLMISLDLVGINRALAQRICLAIKKQHGFERKQIAICTSHTHTGPVVGGNLAALHYQLLDEKQQALVEEYVEFLYEQVVKVVGKAVKDIEPVKVGFQTETATFAVNRRNNREADVPKLREAGELKGPFDHDVPVLAVSDTNDDLKAVAFGYACHSTVLRFYQWSGDYAGFAQIEIEKSHPGCVALFWAGCGADQNPLPRRKVELAKEYGGRLAAAVNRAIEKKGIKPISPKIGATFREIDLALGKPPTREEIEQDAKSTNKYIAARARILLADIEAGRGVRTSYPYAIGTWRLGDEIEWVFLGGEVVVDFALRLKTERRESKTWVAGYSNDVMAYIPSRRVLREGGYEGGGAMVYYGLPTAWSPDVEKDIIDEVNRQLKIAPAE